MNSPAHSIETILAEAVEIPDPVAREAYLNRACGDDPGLRGRVERLAADHFRAGSFLERPSSALAHNATSAYTPTAADLPEGTAIGPYQLLEQIGEGGMGVVYVAEQSVPVRRRVALKVIKPGMDTREVVARFEAERQALALMDHPNIARVLDGGTTPEGRPYFAMELVHGLPITDYCDRAGLPARDRLALFADVCRAVQHAHQKGVIHRDIKPSNVLITLYDGRPVPKVIDFGIAKAIGARLAEKPAYTRFAQLVGTPAYMSPEQAEMSALDVDTRADVYALGVLLYELLTGSTPFDGKALQKAGVDEMRRVIREDEPPRPSHRVSTLGAKARSTVSARRGLDERQLGRLLRGDLDCVVMKALEKDRNRRYESAGAFAEDVERFLADEPVRAVPPSAAYRLRKFARRNKVVLAAGLLVGITMTAGAAVSAWQAVRATRAEHSAEARYDEANLQRARARRAVDEMYTQVAEKWLAQQGRLTAVQTDFLEKALAFYQEFAAESDTDPQVRYEEVRALGRVGLIQSRLRRHSEAEAAFFQAVERAADLAHRHPDRPEFLVEIGYWRVQLAKTYRATGRLKEAEREAVLANDDLRAIQSNSLDDRGHRQRLAVALGELGGELTHAHRLPEADAAVRAALEVWEALVAGFPSEFDYRYGLAKGFERQGMQRMWWGIQKVEAEWSLRQAESRLTALLKEQPGHLAARRTLGQVLGNRAVILRWLKRDAEAEVVERLCLPLDEGLAAEFPDDPNRQSSLASTLGNLAATIQSTSGRTPEAEGFLTRSWDIYDRLADRYPDELKYKVEFLDTGSGLGEYLELAGKHEQGRQVLDRTVRRARDFVKAHSGHLPFQGRLCTYSTDLARALVVNGDHPRAARTLEDLPWLPVPKEVHNPLGNTAFVTSSVRAGRVLLACAALAEQDATLSPTERETVGRAYRARAGVHLEQAVRTADDWAGTFSQYPDNYMFEVGNAVAELLERVPAAGASSLGREIREESTRLMVKALIREAVRRSTDDPKQHVLADLLSTAPEGLRDPELGLKLARRAVERNPADPMCLQSLSWALYRAGDWAGCLEVIAKSSGGTAESEFVLAMAHWRLGNKDEARDRYRRGDEWLTGYEKRVEEGLRKDSRTSLPSPSMLKRLRAEAAALLGVGRSTPEQAPPPRAAGRK